MSLFSSKKFTSTKQIKDTLYNIHSLNFEERKKVFDALVAEMDDGGVSNEEFKKAVRHLREQHEISEIDRDNLLGLL